MNSRLLIGGIISGAVIFAGIYLSRKAAYDKYYDSEINGTINWTTDYRRYTTISVNGNEFNIKSDAKPLNGKMRFYTLAQIKDSIYKPANSDTLKLIHQRKIYLYKGY